MSKTFYAKTANMDADSCDDLILDTAELSDIDLKREQINDKMRQAYVDIAYDGDFLLDAISYGEDYYTRELNKKMAVKIKDILGK